MKNVNRINWHCQTSFKWHDCFFLMNLYSLSLFFFCAIGLAAPAIAAGLGALAPTLGTLIPVIGASGFAAAASAAGTVAGSVAVAASFGGECILIFISWVVKRIR